MRRETHARLIIGAAAMAGLAIGAQGVLAEPGRAANGPPAGGPAPQLGSISPPGVGSPTGSSFSPGFSAPPTSEFSPGFSDSLASSFPPGFVAPGAGAAGSFLPWGAIAPSSALRARGSLPSGDWSWFTLSTVPPAARGFLPWGSPLPVELAGSTPGPGPRGGRPSPAGTASLPTALPPELVAAGGSLPDALGIVLPGPFGLDLALGALGVDSTGLLLPFPSGSGCDGRDGSLTGIDGVDRGLLRLHGLGRHGVRLPRLHHRPAGIRAARWQSS